MSRFSPFLHPADEILLTMERIYRHRMTTTSGGNLSLLSEDGSLWITPAGYVLIYYFLPASVRNPIYSHKLSLVGFWSLALFYPFVGIHHYLYSPIADWAETLAIITSMLLIVPV